ncbi:MAG: tetraacyldisaccharide 4'-kinase [Planctomycetota bacterium]
MSGGDPSAWLPLLRGERRGLVPSVLRGFLALLSAVYAQVLRLRNAAYDWGLKRARRAPLPVLSVGNLTAGGTGKTPLVIALAQTALERGLKVAVLARGYGAAQDGELNDELLEVGERVPQALLVAGRDRVRGAERAARAGAELIVLDDGFQHRRLARDLDVVLVDATDPWGPAGVLPRGLLREPRSGIRRADWVILTRVEQAPERAAALEAEVRALGFRGPLARARSEPLGLVPLRGGAPAGPVFAACALGNPSAFVRGLRAGGLEVVGERAFADHHPYAAADVAGIEAAARAAGAQGVVVSGKDAVKLRPLLDAATLPWATWAIACRLEPEDAIAQIVAAAAAARKDEA